MAEEALARAGADDIHPLALVKDLSLSRRQMVEIAKALARKPRILILDEATSALTAADVTKIYAVLKRLRGGRPRARSTSRIACTRSPSWPTSARCSATAAASPRYAGGHEDRQRGRRADDRPRVQRARFRHGPRAFGDRDAPPLLELRHLGWTDRLNDISLRLHAGEVIGLGGLDGQGQRELLLALVRRAARHDRRGADRRPAVAISRPRRGQAQARSAWR